MAALRPHSSQTRTAVLPTFADVPVQAIRVPDDRLRTFDPDWAAVLAEMFKDSGQQTPIDLLAEGKGFVLISGCTGWKRQSCSNGPRSPRRSCRKTVLLQVMSSWRAAGSAHPITIKPV
jgi:hypothetical protein